MNNAPRTAPPAQAKTEASSRDDVAPTPDTRRIELGRRGEDTVVALIEDWGWTLLDRNWSCRFGEIDIVAMDGHELAIIEVKTRSSLNFGHPAEAVDDRKLQRLGRLAAQWLSEHPDVRAGTVRIDVAAILQQGTYLDCEYLHGVTL